MDLANFHLLSSPPQSLESNHLHCSKTLTVAMAIKTASAIKHIVTTGFTSRESNALSPYYSLGAKVFL